MGRRPRIEVPGGYYHVHSRGNNRQDIYFGNWSGRLFVRELERTSRRHGWRVLAYCLMPNHYHLVVQIDHRLSAGMEELNGRFARISNWVNKRKDHLFGSRFKDHLIEDEEYLLTVIRYVLLNPVRSIAGVRRAEHWRWSSMRATLGLDHAPACLDTAFVLAFFSSRPGRARVRFREWVNSEVLPAPPRRTGTGGGGPAARTSGVAQSP